MKILPLIALLLVSSLPLLTATEPPRSPENQVLQFMQRDVLEYAPGVVVRTTAYLWIPDECQRLRGLLILGENVTEHGLVGHPSIREACAAFDLGIVWYSPRFMSVKTLDDSAMHVLFLLRTF